MRAAAETAETCEARAGAALQRVSHLRASVAELFAAAGCQPGAVAELLGDKAGTDIMVYLGVVEQTLSLMLQASRPLFSRT